jgi:hypothetical protein
MNEYICQLTYSDGLLSVTDHNAPSGVGSHWDPTPGTNGTLSWQLSVPLVMQWGEGVVACKGTALVKEFRCLTASSVFQWWWWSWTGCGGCGSQLSVLLFMGWVWGFRAI